MENVNKRSGDGLGKTGKSLGKTSNGDGLMKEERQDKENKKFNNQKNINRSRDLRDRKNSSGDRGKSSKEGCHNSYEDFDRVLRSALVGEERARAKILSMLDPLIRSSIKRYCPVYSEFDDLYSDGRYMVLFCLENFDGKRSFLKYVKDYLKFTYLDNYKYLTNVERDLHDDDSDEEGLSIFDSLDAGVDIEADFLEAERKGILRDALDSLTPRQETVVRLFYYERLGLSEIADFLGISKRTVVNLKVAAIVNLRKFILNKNF